MNYENPCTAFAGHTKIAEGSVLEVAAKVKRYLLKQPDQHVLIFDDVTSGQVELDLRGSVEDVLKRIGSEDKTQAEKAGPGRPKLGVVSREIGLLPRHWDWLALQPGGASVTLRKLVEDAKKQTKGRDAIRLSQNAAYKFMSAMAGDMPHFEEASRAFFAKNKPLFETLCAAWPKDIREYILRVGAAAFQSDENTTR
ncbi:MAG: DUF2239 family protein [Pseudobdellovibrionaceae bacterium]|nr:DUF2239 family protein [Pseudobdellovibrionaceae bacterium]